MPFPLTPPVPHPHQPGVMLDSLAVERLTLSDGSGIDAPPKMVVILRPYAEVAQGQVTAAIAGPPDRGLIELGVDNLHAWVAERAALGDMLPAQAMATLVQAVAEEYARRNPPA